MNEWNNVYCLYTLKLDLNENISKDALNWPHVMVKTFVMLQNDFYVK